MDRRFRALRDEPAPPAVGFDVRSIGGLLRRQARLIIATTLAILALAIAATVMMEPRYSATALVLVDPSDKNLLRPSSRPADAQADSARVDSEVEILKSDAVLTEVIAAKNLITDPDFAVRLGLRDKLLGLVGLGSEQSVSKQPTPDSVLRTLSKSLSIQRRADTYLIAVQVAWRDPQKAAELANAVVQAYIQRQVQSKVDSTLSASAAVQKQLDQTREAVIVAEQKFNGYISDNMDRLIALSGEPELRSKRDALNALFGQTQRDEAEASALRDSVQKKDWSALSKQLATETATALSRQHAELLAALDETQADSAAAVDIQTQISGVEDTLLRAATNEMGQLQATISTSQSRLTDLKQELTTAVSKSDLSPDVLAQIYELQQDTRNTTANYQSLLTRLQELETQSSLQVADSRIASPALTPSSPSFPRIPLIVVFAGVFGFAAAVTLAFLRENLVGGFTSTEQIAAVTRHRLVTAIPRQAIAAGHMSLADQLVIAPLSRYSEGVRRVRAMIDRMLPNMSDTDEVEAKVVLVTSAMPDEGKTTIALSLARAYAQAGQRTIIIDCDLRRPSLHRHLNCQPSGGLIDYLSGKVEPDQFSRVVIRDKETPLTAIVGSRDATIPTDKLFSAALFARLLAATKKRFDVVILDSPPLGAVIDSEYLADHADVVAFVVRWASTPQRAVTEALESLSFTKSDDAKTLIVMNQSAAESRRAGAAYSSYYREQPAGE